MEQEERTQEDSSEELATCSCCSESSHLCEMIAHNDEIYCDDCFDEHFTRCYGCSETILMSHSHFEDEVFWCESCFSETFAYCADCERYYYICDLNCPNCRVRLLPYHTKVCDILHKFEYNETCFGLEIELNNEDNIQEAIKYTKKNLNIPHIWKEDGSLSNGGELVLAPCDRERLSSLNWRKILKELHSLGCRGYDSGECGIHIHASKTEFNHLSYNEFNTLILDFLISQRQFLKPFSQRKKFNYCELPKDYNDTEWLLESRYRAINVLPDSTYEFRVYRSTTDYERFYASLQFTFLAHKYLVFQARNPTSKLKLKDYLMQNRNEHKPIFDYLIKTDLINLLDQDFTRNNFIKERKKHHVHHISQQEQEIAA